MLWSGVHPPGNAGQATLGGELGLQTLVSFNGVTFVSSDHRRAARLRPDRSRDGAGCGARWMNSNGYPTDGVWYPSVAVVGFPFHYMALVSGHWDMVIRVGG